MDILNPNNISFSYLPQNISQVSLSCETPLTYLLLNSSDNGNCAAATLTQVVDALGVSVLCGLPNLKEPYPVGLTNAIFWNQSGFLNKINSTVVCPKGQDMQLISIFNGSVAGKFSLEIENSEDICVNSANNPLSRLERDLQVANTTFKIGLNAKESLCYPDYVPYPKPFENSYFNPFKHFLNAYVESVQDGCQKVSLIDSTIKRDFFNNSQLPYTFFCAPWDDESSKLSQDSFLGDKMTCKPTAKKSGSMLTVMAFPVQFQQNYNNITATFKRVVTSCTHLEKTTTSSLSVDKEMKYFGYGVLASVFIVGGALGLIHKFFPHRDPFHSFSNQV